MEKQNRIKKIMGNKWVKNLFIIICFIGIMTIWWQVRLQYEFPREEQILESGESMTFVPKFEQIHRFGFSCDDMDAPYYPKDNVVSVKFEIKDKSGNSVWEQSFKDIIITPYEISQIDGVENLPVFLKTNEEYTFVYESKDMKPGTLTVALYGLEEEVLPFYILVCTMILGVVILAMYIKDAHISSKRKTVFMAIIYLLLGVLYNIVFVPFSVQDEPTHFAQAYAMSSEWLGEEVKNEKGYIYMYQSGLVRVDWGNDLQTQYHFWNDWDYGNIPSQSISIMYKDATELHKYAYTIPAIGITIARVLHLPYQMVLLSGRILNALFFLAIAALALRINPNMKRSMLAILMLPSIVWLSASYSYDIWNMGFCALFFSYCMYCRNKEGKVNWKDVLALLAICIAFIPIKFIYFVMAFGVLLIPGEKFSKRLEQFGTYAIVILGSVITAFVARGSSALSYATTSNVDIRSITDATAQRQAFSLNWILASAGNLLYTIKVYINTIFVQGENYLYKVVNGSYLSFEPPKILIYILLFIVLIIIIDEMRDVSVSLCDRIIAAGVFAMGVGLVLTTFLFVYTHVSIQSVGTISGVQGRYFLPFLLFVPFIIQGKYIKIDENKKDTLVFLLLIMNLWVIMCNFSGVLRG